jgi:hypothetical protein
MTTRTRMNVYFSPDLLKQVEALALRRNVSKSASSRQPSHPSCPATRPDGWKRPCRAAWTSSAASSTRWTRIRNRRRARRAHAAHRARAASPGFWKTPPSSR